MGINEGPRLEEHWDDILNELCLNFLAVEVYGMIVSFYCLAIIKNLTRCMRPYGIVLLVQ